MELVFKFQEFEGPLDLIIYLVKKKKLSIRDIPLSQLADEFYEYLQQMKNLNLNITSEFIVTASYLMELKSKSLLPRSSEDESFKISKEKFYSQVEQYAALKDLVEKVKNSENLNIEKMPVSVKTVFPKINEKKLKDIIKNAIKEVELKQKVYKIKKEEITIETIMSKVLNSNINKNLYEILKNLNSKYEIIMYFLAILELIKLKKITLDEEFYIRSV
ncbi:chromosome segregation and condensation protein ScpA [Thermosipho africanus Ob7]|jgi:segregation and condensation protein A|uniref:Segregation and condensation protein A n=1 Tax=Thermosipho africanus (strain TCF52B) TaxID=484019 RepID=B7IDK4_THEAB|nr:MULTISPECIES: ScpA family protein [Thermosipho]HCF38819.1 segregation/condensation protein A [Thermosipho africanus]ACJ76081.1 segregation and condensation protein A [Thermosipho africanus TCF52B]MBZ4649724.1 scpA [Thermosipho sp. (in: thermotogales)]MDK2839924.1 segregation and condensation protein [Thermosipho sp. (in: thermotogales)]MDK2900689.1 segregation and condensation protein [Thermosipho sp. (in: thermotogales)]